MACDESSIKVPQGSRKNYAAYVAEGILFLLGIFLFILVIRSTGVSRLVEIFSSLKAWECWVFALYPLMCAWDVLAWQVVLSPGQSRKPLFFEIFWIRLIGEAVNNLTPVLDVGGEPLKVTLLSRRLSTSKITAAAAAVLGRTALFASEIIFIVLGLGFSVFLMPIPPDWRNGFLLAIGIFILMTAALILMQKKGIFAALVGFSRRLGINRLWSERVDAPMEAVDRAIAIFYQEDKKKFIMASLWHGVGWLSGGFEMMWMSHLVGAPMTLAEGLMLEALLQLVRTASFFIPGNLGAQEAGLGLLMGWLGYSPALGVVVSLLKRFRQIIWTGIGFILWGAYRLMGSPAK